MIFVLNETKDQGCLIKIVPKGLFLMAPTRALGVAYMIITPLEV